MGSEPAHILAADYGAKADGYFEQARRDWIDPLPLNRSASILELGCGTGATGALALRDGKCGSYVGVELSEEAAAQARTVLTQVHVGNVEVMDVPYEDEFFDVLICGEVLEHLVDPLATLKRLVKLLKPGGLMFASVPNISHWRVISDLIFGRFDYTDWGVMDRTHLRWFTPRTFRRLIEEAGIDVDHLGPLAGPRSRWLRSTLPLGHMTWVQIDMHGHKPSR